MEEEGTLERHSSNKSSGREEIGGVVVATVDGWWIATSDLASEGFGKQDFMSHEKCRELQLSDIRFSSQNKFIPKTCN